MRFLIIGRRSVQASLTRPLCPTGKSAFGPLQSLSSPPAKNISLNVSGKSALPARPVLSRQEGRIAIVTNAGGDAVDAAASARNGVAGRVSRERYLRAGRTALMR